MEWDGSERRKSVSENMSEFSHLLTNMDKNLALLTQTFHDHAEDLKQHTADDKIQFTEIKKKIEWSDKIIFMGLGAVALISFMTKFIK